MSGEQLHGEWAVLAEQAGIRQSLSGLADASGKPTSTISRLVKHGRTSRGTIEAVASALRVSAERVWSLAHQSGHPDLGRWEPPKEAHSLGADEREALERLIRVMAKEDEINAESAAQEKMSGQAPQPAGGTVVRPAFGVGSRQGQMLEDAQPVDRAADDCGEDGQGAPGVDRG